MNKEYQSPIGLETQLRDAESALSTNKHKISELKVKLQTYVRQAKQREQELAAIHPLASHHIDRMQSYRVDATKVSVAIKKASSKMRYELQQYDTKSSRKVLTQQVIQQITLLEQG